MLISLKSIDLHRQSWWRWAALVALVFTAVFEFAANAAALEFTTPTNSSPIAISRDQQFVWVVNPRDDTVSVLRTGTNTVIATIGTGDEPRSVAVDPNNNYAFVANAAGNSVTIIRIIDDSPANFAAVVEKTVKTGAEPWNIVISPNGKRVFVANSGQDTITVINAVTRNIIGHVDLRNSVCNAPNHQRRFQPRGMAVILSSSQLYVTRFLSFTKDTGGRQGIDLGKEGALCRIAINTASISIGGYVPAEVVKFAPRVTGFNVDSNGDGVADPTRAFPNQMQSIVIRGNRGFMPNIAASPTSPLVFNTDTQAFLTFLNDVGTGFLTDGGALNLHLGAKNPEAGKKRLFFSNPWAIAFTTQSGAGVRLCRIGRQRSPRKTQSHRRQQGGVHRRCGHDTLYRLERSGQCRDARRQSRQESRWYRNYIQRRHGPMSRISFQATCQSSIPLPTRSSKSFKRPTCHFRVRLRRICRSAPRCSFHRVAISSARPAPRFQRRKGFPPKAGRIAPVAISMAGPTGLYGSSALARGNRSTLRALLTRKTATSKKSSTTRRFSMRSRISRPISAMSRAPEIWRRRNHVKPVQVLAIGQEPRPADWRQRQHQRGALRC